MSKHIKKKNMKSQEEMLICLHDFKLGDSVYHRADSAPFMVVGISKTEVEIQGDWSGGTHCVNQKSWVNCGEIELYDEKKVKYYIGGKPYRNGHQIF